MTLRNTLLREVIALPSVSSANAALDMSNRAVAEWLANRIEAAGGRAELLPIPDVPGKFNVLGSFGNGPGGLVLSGHTDTVPFDAARWQFDPFAVTERDDRLYGLGIADMKSFFPLALEALSGLALDKLAAPVYLLGTADEESSMSGAKALGNMPWQGPRAAVIGEPTGMRPIRLHKGVFFESIRIQGKAGHSSNPAFGNNALDGMYRVLGALMTLREELAERHRHPGFAVASPTLNFGHIHGGDAPNRICQECELHIDLRLLPGMSLTELRDTIHRRARSALENTGLAVSFSALYDGVEALETPADAAIVGAAEALTGAAAESVAFTTEGPYFKALGIDTLILGPGDIDQAHQPDEWLAGDRLDRYVAVLRQLIQRFCFTSD